MGWLQGSVRPRSVVLGLLVVLMLMREEGRGGTVADQAGGCRGGGGGTVVDDSGPGRGVQGDWENGCCCVTYVLKVVDGVGVGPCTERVWEAGGGGGDGLREGCSEPCEMLVRQLEGLLGPAGSISLFS